MLSRSSRAAAGKVGPLTASASAPAACRAASGVAPSALPVASAPALRRRAGGIFQAQCVAQQSKSKRPPRHSALRHASTATATATVQRSTPPPSAATPSSSSTISDELRTIRSSLFHLLGSSHPSLDAIAKYYFRAEGKHLRPTLVLLLAQATNGLAAGKGAQGQSGWERVYARDQATGGQYAVDESLTAVEGVLNDWNPEVMGQEKEGDMVFAQPFVVKEGRERIRRDAHSDSARRAAEALQPSSGSSAPILSTQRRLASITEMIHVASLLHDDVIDASPLRRSAPSAPAQFGNKLSILSGDFLLGRASVALARLGNSEVVELLATVIANLVEGEVMQLRSPIVAPGNVDKGPTPEAFEIYMRKTYLKTASLMAKSARASVILGGCGEDPASEWVKEAAYAYGRNLGIAFQLIDDMLDFLPPSPTLGKPGLGADLSLGLATAPALFAWQTHAALGPLIARKFSEPGDVETARELVGRSDGLERTRELARRFASEAERSLERVPDSEAKAQLVGLTRKVVERVA